MIHRTLHFAFLLLTLQLFSCMNTSPYFEYADGNGNLYIITDSTLRYAPVSPEKSSSGFYSGGAGKTKPITSPQFAAIQRLIMQAIDKPSDHISERVKMSGAISVIEGNDRKQYILSPRSATQIDIETTLKEIISE